MRKERAMEIVAGVVRALHIVFVLWVLWAPVFGDRETLIVHAAVCPFLMLHWLAMSDECALTRLEMYLRGMEAADRPRSFVHSIVGPIYVISDDAVRRVAWVVTMAAWGLSLYRLGVFTPSMRR